MKYIRFGCTSALVCAGLICARAEAATVVSPSGFAATEGNQANGYPFNLAIFSFSSQRYQQVYDSTDFTAPGVPVLITQIAFRPDAFMGSAFSSTLPNIQIDLSTTSAAVDALSTTFASNVGADDTVVHSGSLSLSSADTGPSSGPKDFDILIPLTTPFLYDPALGNLLLDVRNFGGGGSTQFDMEFSATDSTSRVYSEDVNSTSSDTPDSSGLVTQFTFAVPEPMSGGVLCLTVLLIFLPRSPKRLLPT